MYYLAAFITGLLGSFHCLGMCGPIAMIAPTADSYGRFITGRLIYNAGRIATYSLIGLVMGTFGMGLQLAGIQQYISIIMGIILLVIAFGQITGISVFGRYKLLDNYKNRVQKQFAKFLSKSSLWAQFAVGVLNGLLPCGLVYIALAGALTTGTYLQGAAYMALFGLGTLPMMFSISISSRWVTKNVRAKMVKVIPYFVGFIAILFIVRGMNLGIPYLSPKLNAHNQMECCEAPRK
jgi:uncharacterized protein